ncbi:hypothetical protein [Leptospirillum ferriphilum]|uniref:hypothetical protein n=1 Tax=Leptospirillum ferriphilum TaxID=178606 RepID=UPI0006B23354|nr:hypothetical protein [Leptospirillum ferriphilum]
MSKKTLVFPLVLMSLVLGACTKGPSIDSIKQAEITAGLKEAAALENSLGGKIDQSAARKKMESLILEKDSKCVTLEKNKYRCVYQQSVDKGLTFQKRERTFVKNADGSYTMTN